MRVLTASDRALLVEFADLDEALRMHRAWAGVPGVLERVPGARSVLVRFDPLATTAAALADALRAATGEGSAPASAAEVTIPVHYDGDDLAEVSALLGIPPDEVVRRHAAARWTVAFSGFAPGFGYLVGDDPLFDVPRRSSPRTRVPAGAVALAGAFTGVYPRQSPGGWQLIGRTDAVMWDVHRDPPALLAPGTAVRFVRASDPSEMPDTPVVERRAGTRHADAEADALRSPTVPPALEVVHPGLKLLVQDLGRPGRAELGVPASGAADGTALSDANRAVGNTAGVPALEGVGPVTLRVCAAEVLAVTGAESDLLVTGADGRQRAVAHGAPFAVAVGDELQIGPPHTGLRFMLGVRGGIRVRAELGSSATDTLSGLGPAPLRAGDVVPAGDAVACAVQPDALPRPLPAPGELVELGITIGPRDDWFTADALRLLIEQEWLVTPRSDRVGIRLQGASPLQRAVPGELPSEGVVDGAIQVPADGQPVLFLRDHPTTGGYPVIGALTAAALDLAGQLAPGMRVRFRARDL